MIPTSINSHQAGRGAKSGSQSKSSGGGQSQSPETPPEAKDVRMIGTAIFKKNKLVGNFDIYETQVLQILTGQFREALLTIDDPLKEKYQIAYRLMATTSPQIKYRHIKSLDTFRVKIKMEADLVSIQSGIDYTKPLNEALLGKRISRELERRIGKTIKKAQQYNSDVFGFGVKVRNTMLTGPDWDHYHWPEKFRDAKIDVRVKVALRRVGVQFHPPSPR